MQRIATALLLAFLAAHLHADVRLSRGGQRVRVNELGLLTLTPAGGLSTLGGPTAFLEGRCAEWFSVEYASPGGLVQAAAAGNEPDWAGRTPVEPLSFWWNPDRAVSVVRVGALDVETEITWDPDGPYLLGHVTFVNRGSASIDSVFYTREWRQPGAPGTSFPPDMPMSPSVPDGIIRLVWMTDEIEPGGEAEVRFSYELGPLTQTTGDVDVPLRRFFSSDFPAGVNFGMTNGISWGDYDMDGWIDVFALESARLWRNVDGKTWELAADLDSVLPPVNNRYGSSFGDYDNDGLPDIGCEPRDGFFDLLRNLGDGPNFVDVAGDPAIVDMRPFGASETICWGDVDDDADLDMFLPVYPPFAGGPGNFFLENLGPTGPGGAYRFTETSAAAGLNNPPGAARPEGAQFADVDFDGDMDLYSNGTLYQNVSVDEPRFEDATDSAGIGLRNRLDEGASLFDYDMDGDFDLVIVYSGPGVRIWENRGDGSFFRADGLVDCPFVGLDLGLSAEDWDNDGDIDFTTRQIFRRNMLVETGERHFTVATVMINPQHLTSATPAWADWDRDGDLDCALGNWMHVGRFYENILYDETTPESEKPYVRVRVVRDTAQIGPGLETEYGAVVELRLAGDPPGVKRKKIVSSSAGYLNQNEYTLHFALPPGDPTPVDQVFDVVVDFPGRPDRGILRVDRFVNPALGGIRLADLHDREIVVHRSGRVIIDGVSRPPVTSDKEARMRTTGGGLQRPTATEPVPEPVPAPDEGHWVGIELTTYGMPGRALVKEIVLDGQLDVAVSCADGDYNLAVWDVTASSGPTIVARMALSTSERNDRSYFPAAVVLEPDRLYRLVARVTELRATPLPGPTYEDPIKLRGGLSFQDLDPCSGAAVVAAPLDPANVYLAVRHTREAGSAFDARPIQPPPAGGVHPDTAAPSPTDKIRR